MLENNTVENSFAGKGAVEMMDTYHFEADPEMRALLEKADINGEIAQHVYDLRDAIGWNQAEFAELVGVLPSVIEDVEESAYEGDTLAVLGQIEKAFLKHFEPQWDAAKTLYPNALLSATITGFKFRYFRYHCGRTAPLDSACATASPRNLKKPQTIQYLLEALEPWQHALKRNRQELKIFALAGITEWCHLDRSFYIAFSGKPDEHMRAVDVHRQLIDAFVQYLHTGERTALKQWRQVLGPQEQTRYLTELEKALHERTFAEFPDTEWLVKELIGFVEVPH